MGQEPETPKWYVVKTISGKENKAKEYIEAEVAKRNWADIVPQVLIPTETKVTNVNGKRKVKEAKLYSGYVFIQACMRIEVKAVIQNIPNVINFICENNGTPIPMRSYEVNHLLKIMDDQTDAYASSDVTFFVNDKVKVREGAFQDFEGVVIEVSNEKRKLLVNVTFFNRTTSLELAFNQVEKL